MADTRVAVRPVPQQQFSVEQIALIKSTVARDASAEEFKLFLEVCRARGLNPLLKQIYAISRYDWKSKSNRMTIQTSIDGFRLLAQRTGKYAGQLGPWFCGEDEVWHEVWTKKEPPIAAKIGILRHDFKEPLYTVALYQDYVQTDKDGNPTAMWKKMFCVMLAKCCESLGLRRAFPEELGGLYTDAEMMQADSPMPAVSIVPTQDTINAVAVEGEIVDTPIQHVEPQQAAQQVQAVQTPVTQSVPSIKALQTRCRELFGVGQWAAVKVKLLGANIPDDNMTPEDQAKIHTAFDLHVAKLAKKAS